MFNNSKYRVLNQQEFSKDEFHIIPIRYEDRFRIMKWRNDQISNLRQNNLLTKEAQETYFKEVVSKLFNEENPSQILFSFMKENEFIGYGGLVHINWKDKNAEISFLLNTDLNTESSYKELINVFLVLIEQVAKDINLHKIFTYGYDLVNYRFEPLINQRYDLEATLREHVSIDNEYVDVKIYSKIF